MSNIYVLEPHTNGKVCLHTTVGDIDIELWSKECPKAVRNFVQLCMEGYYDGTIFHRVVPKFIVQGGDPTGTGAGGESIYGQPFKDEFHQRLRFTRRGLVAMANAGKNDNASQFFFTLDKTPELDKKHTIFGKVVGDTMFNMLKLGESDVDQHERPHHPHKILTTEIISNPFTDIEPREKVKRPKKEDKKRKEKGTKNFKLLSFGEEAEEDEEEVTAVTKTISQKGKSAHDLLHDDKLSAEPAVTSDEIGSNAKGEDGESSNSDTEPSGQLQSVRDKLRRAKQHSRSATTKRGKLDADEDDDLNRMLEEERNKAHQEKIDKLRSEAKKIKKDLIAELRPKKNAEEEEDDSKNLPEAIKKFREERVKYLKQTKTHAKGADRESSTMDLLERFKQRLTSAKTEVIKTGQKQKTMDERLEQSTAAMAEVKSRREEPDIGEEAQPSLVDYDEDDEGETPNIAKHIDVEDYKDDSWMAHRFEASETQPKQAKDANMRDKDTSEWYDISDPRNPINRRRREADVKEVVTSAVKQAKII